MEPVLYSLSRPTLVFRKNPRRTAHHFGPLLFPVTGSQLWWSGGRTRKSVSQSLRFQDSFPRFFRPFVATGPGRYVWGGCVCVCVWSSLPSPLLWWRTVSVRSVRTCVVSPQDPRGRRPRRSKAETKGRRDRTLASSHVPLSEPEDGVPKRLDGVVLALRDFGLC